MLYLGGDLDKNNQPIPDFTSLRFNRLLQRYEFTSKVWDFANQRFVPAETESELDAGTEKRHWYFYTTVDVEQTRLDLRDGDDVFRGDAGYVFSGDQTGSQWGLGEGDQQAGGGVAQSQFTVSGGAGNDQLYGGVYGETLLGGDGNDFVGGGLGDDDIDGGAGNDILAGLEGVAPDIYEYVDRSFGSDSNNSFAFAAELPEVFGGRVVQANFHYGDTVDWYVVRPRTGMMFSSEDVGRLTEEMVSVFELERTPDGDLQRTSTLLNHRLFTTIVTGTPEEPNLVPVTLAPGAAEALLLRVDNRVLGDAFVRQRPREYEIEFDADLAATLDVSVERLTDSPASGFARRPLDLQSGSTGKGVVIPVGDFNNDGHDDYILSLREIVAGGAFGITDYAYLYYGGPGGLLDPAATDLQGMPFTEIELPAGVIDIGDGNQATIGPPGDVDGDGSDDILISIEQQEGAGRFFVVFGGTDQPAFLSAFDPNEPRTVEVSGFQRALNARPAGDLNGDGRDDVVAVDGNATYLFAGRTRAEWATVSQATPDATYALPAYRSAPLGDFDGDGYNDFGTVNDTQLRIFFGNSNGAFTGLTQVFASGSFSNADLLAAGSLNGDSLPDAIISGLESANFAGGDGVSYLVESNGRAAPTLTASSLVYLRPISDITGDGLTDLAVNQQEAVDMGGNPTGDPNPNPPERTHAVTHVFLSDSETDIVSRLAASDVAPDLILEMSDSLFLDPTNFRTNALVTPVFNPVGDIGPAGGDGIADLALFSPYRAGLSVIFGNSLSADATHSGVAALGSETTPFELAQPFAITTQNVGIDLHDEQDTSLRDAISIQGERDDEQLSRVRTVGDTNGDEFVDFVISGSDVSYFVYGPFREQERLAVTDVSAIAVATSATPVPFTRNGKVAKGSGDLVQLDPNFTIPVSTIGADGIDDLVTYGSFCDAGGNCNRMDISFITGGESFNENLTSDTIVRVSVLTPHVRDALEVAVLDWNGTAGDDLLIANREGGVAEVARVSSFDTGSFASTLTINRGALVAPTGYAVNAAAGFVVSPLGDIDGDGRTDIGIASPNLYQAPGQGDLGAVFVITGGSSRHD